MTLLKYFITIFIFIFINGCNTLLDNSNLESKLQEKQEPVIESPRELTKEEKYEYLLKEFKLYLAEEDCEVYIKKGDSLGKCDITEEKMKEMFNAIKKQFKSSNLKKRLEKKANAKNMTLFEYLLSVYGQYDDYITSELIFPPIEEMENSEFFDKWLKTGKKKNNLQNNADILNKNHPTFWNEVPCYTLHNGRHSLKNPAEDKCTASQKEQFYKDLYDYDPDLALAFLTFDIQEKKKLIEIIKISDYSTTIQYNKKTGTKIKSIRDLDLVCENLIYSLANKIPFNRYTIYKLHNLQVLQVKKDIVLANFPSYSYFAHFNRTIAIKNIPTKDLYDNQELTRYYAIYVGNLKYYNVLGAERTIPQFKVIASEDDDFLYLYNHLKIYAKCKG